MKKYNLSTIMKRAWELVKESAMTISSGLKKAWKEAKMNYLAVKEWFFNKEQEKAGRYNVFMDFKRTEAGIAEIVDDYIFLKIEKVIKETEKAIQVKISSGDVIGSYKGWTCWIPKSLTK
nr:MAG TPA: hypothetical protein [Caudoviricetes sp.]